MPRKKIQNSKFKIQNYISKFKSFKLSRKKIALILLIIGLALLIYYKKGWFVAATVNGQPISNFELLSRMSKQYKEQTLNQMINEQIIFDEGRKNGIIITEADLDKRIKEIEDEIAKNYQGKETLESLLSQKGQSREDLRKELRIQILITKLYEKGATVSAQEVDDYVEKNKNFLQSTDSAKQKEEARNSLKQQKLGQIFNERFQQLRQSAKIQIF